MIGALNKNGKNMNDDLNENYVMKPLYDEKMITFLTWYDEMTVMPKLNGYLFTLIYFSNSCFWLLYIFYFAVVGYIIIWLMAGWNFLTPKSLYL